MHKASPRKSTSGACRSGREFDLLGQDELGPSALENAFKDQIAKAAAEGNWTEQQTERILLAAARVGQHVFALNVLANCGERCVFCGLNPGSFGAKRMLVAGDSKPWKDSTSAERLDLRNGLAACPSHDVAFDTGLLTVNAGLQVHISSTLADGRLAWDQHLRCLTRNQVQSGAEHVSSA